MVLQGEQEDPEAHKMVLLDHVVQVELQHAP